MRRFRLVGRLPEFGANRLQKRTEVRVGLFHLVQNRVGIFLIAPEPGKPVGLPRWPGERGPVRCSLKQFIGGRLAHFVQLIAHAPEFVLNTPLCQEDPEFAQVPQGLFLARLNHADRFRKLNHQLAWAIPARRNRRAA